MQAIENAVHQVQQPSLPVRSFIVILPQTNNNLPGGEKNVTYGEFLQWIGLWLLMSTLIGPQ